MYFGTHSENLSSKRMCDLRREREDIILEIIRLAKEISAKKGGIRFVPKDKFAWYPTQKQW